MLTLLKKRPIIQLVLIISSLFIFVWKVVRCHSFDCERVSSLSLSHMMARAPRERERERHKILINLDTCID